MGIIEKILKPTPFFSLYENYRQKKTEREQVRLEEILMPERIRFYKQFIQPGQLVFDVGANVGNRVEAFLKCQLKVVAVEPQPACVATLQQKFGSSIIIENVGLNEADGELEMVIATDSTVSSFSKEYINKTQKRFKYSKWEKTIMVKVTTLDTLLQKHGVPHFCKIDVEGFELQVLKGLKQPIPYISIEYCVPEMQEQNKECLEYLNNLSPNATYNYSIGETMQWGLSEWKNYNDFMGHIASKEFVETSFGDIYIKSI